MAKKAQPVESKWCVVSVRERGLDRSVQVHGPFTRKEAFVVAKYREAEDGDVCMVEELIPLCDHNSWVLEDE